MTAWRVACLFGLGVALVGCGRTDRREGAPGEGGGDRPPLGAGGSAGTAGASAGGGEGRQCEAGDSPPPAPAPFGRLDHTELNNSVRALLPAGTSEAGLPWLPETEDDLPKYSPSLDTVKALHDLAHAVALRLTENAAEGWLAECDVAGQGEEACRDALAEPFVERAYRRGLGDEDRREIAEVFAEGRASGGDYESGMRAVVEVTLQSPDFAYLLELAAEGEPGDVVELNGYQSAARLSYFLTASPPDEDLAEAAKAGPLGPDELGAHAERLLASSRSRQALSGFYLRRMRSSRLREVPQLGFDTELAAAVVESSRRFVEDAMFSGAGTFSALLTAPYGWTNGALARYYGYPMSGTDWQKVMLDPTQRGGLFTQPAFLASTSRGAAPSAVRRSVALLTQVLCYDVPPPPVEVAISGAELPPDQSERGLLEYDTKDASCRECHQYINPVGFAFGHYDAVGRWRDIDRGQPIDSSGTLDRTDAAGSFTDALGLMQSVASSDEAKGCFVRLWLEHAGRRWYEPLEACSLEALTTRFLESDGQVVDLLRDIAESNTFRYRVKTELPTGEP